MALSTSVCVPFRYVLFEIGEDQKTVVVKGEPVAKGGTCKEDWDAFATVLNGEMVNSPCYACFDFDWEAADGHAVTKLIFVTWVPDSAKIKIKMLTASTKDAVKRAFVGIGQVKSCTPAAAPPCLSRKLRDGCLPAPRAATPADRRFGLVPRPFLQDFQATDASEITYECALDKCQSATTSG